MRYFETFFRRWQALFGRLKAIDRFLLGALFAGVLFGSLGMGWGRYDCLNLDRMAFKSVMSPDRAPFEPASFRKPPFYTYLMLVGARWPAEFVGRNLFFASLDTRKEARLILRTALARFWNLMMFAAVVGMVFSLAKQAYGPGAARVSAWVLATSAGFVPYQVYLTTDLAVVFMMMSVLFCAVRIVKSPDMGISILAGLLAGLCAAVKYNGLSIAVCLPLAHLLASRGNPVWACLRRPAAWLCGLSVPLGFLIGNPYAVLNFPKFREDFLYNYYVTPVYNGASHGTGYLDFLRRFDEIFGRPGTLLLAVAVLLSLFAVLQAFRHGPSLQWKIWLLAAAAFGLYFLKIGAFPRMETRFVLPVAPYFLLLASIGFPLLFRWRAASVAVFSLVVAYNIASSWMLAELFRKDPRMELLGWADRHFGRKDVIETSGACPQWRHLPDARFTIHKMPSGLERKEIFSRMFANNPEMIARVGRFESSEDISWFSPEAREARRPRWIAWCTIDLESPARPYFDALEKGDSGYRIVFDRSSPSLPFWAYPRYTEFLWNRTVLWEREISEVNAP